MNYEEKMNTLLEENLTEIAYKFWTTLKEKIPPVWDRLSSSSKKYHKKDNGQSDNIAEHTYEMLYACIKTWSLFDIKKKTSEGDVLLLAIALHDSFKYGEDPDNSEHTVSNHDKIIADKLKSISNFTSTFLSESQINTLDEATRFHNGRWSTDVEDMTKFDLSDYHQYTGFVHFLDMMSSRNLIKLPKEG